MTSTYRFLGHRTAVLAAALWVGMGTASAADAQSASWQHHHVTFNYFGITSRYSCDGMEQKVRQILIFLGARADADVRATDCPRGPDSISRSIYVIADFSTLAAAEPNAVAVGVTPATWIPALLARSRPYFMDDGDCELVDQMRKVLTDNFSWRGQVTFSASCPPYTTQINDYRVQGEILRASPERAP